LSVKDLIRTQDFFNSLNDEQIEQLSHISSLHTYKKENVLYYEQQECTNLFFLVKGLAKAYKIDKHENETFLYYMYENSMLSEISDINSNTLHPFSNVVFVEDSQVLHVNYAKFKELFLANHILCFQFTNAVIERSLRLESLVSREFIFDAVSKVSMMLHNDLAMFNKLKRHDISLMLHIQPATLSRVLNRLKRNGIIDIIHGEIEIINDMELEAVYKDKIDE